MATVPATRVNLLPALFTPLETEFVRHNDLIVSVFSQNGVSCLRIRNGRGFIVCLPFQGQQIWDAEFDGRRLTMKSMFEKPKPTREYLENYGGFLLHCGISAMGCPGAQDRHPLHGELPNAPIDEAWLELGYEDAAKTHAYVRLCGEWRYTVAFTCNYLIRLSVKLASKQALINVNVDVTNLRMHGTVPLMYLAHVNFRPVDGALLRYSVQPNAQHIRVRTAVPSHVTLSPKILAWIKSLAAEPTQHDKLSDAQPYDPEVVLYLDYLTDDNGWAHSLQVLPDGTADYIRHHPVQLPKAVRWVSRTGDQDALGLCLPATAEPEGFAAEKAKNNIVMLGPGERWSTEYEAGALSATEAQDITTLIQCTLHRK